jgi:hypothetical protein
VIFSQKQSRNIGDGGLMIGRVAQTFYDIHNVKKMDNHAKNRFFRGADDIFICCCRMKV